MILSKEIAGKKMRRMAMEVAERNNELKEIILIGIQEHGMVIAEKIAGFLSHVFKGEVQLISLHIDKKNPGRVELSHNPGFGGSTIILIDDVANSGRTMLYALKPLLDEHPASIQTMALVERTHKLFPVAVDYIGLSVSTSHQQMIIVDVQNGEVTGAYLAN